MRAVCAALFLSILAQGAWANARVTVLMDLMRTADLIEIFRTEGMARAQLLDQQYLDGRGGAFLQAQVAQIFEVDPIREHVRHALEAALTDRELDEAIRYFASDQGSRVIGLEIAARLAIADPDVEQTARADYAAHVRDKSALAETISDFILAGDLLERNVSGAMSVNLHFLTGLADGGYSDQSEDEIIADTMSRQQSIRTDTGEWLGAYLLMAYAPLSAPERARHLRFTQSGTGRALNAALFDGFEPVYRGVAYALGRAIALNSGSDEI